MRKGFITINLLPYREKQKALRVKKFSATMIMFATMGLFLVAAWHVFVMLKIDNGKDRNAFIETENKKLDETIKSIAGLKEEIKKTLEKRKIVESLQVNRADGVNIVNNIANTLPDNTYLKSIKKVDEAVSLVGLTSANNKVSNYMTALDETDVFENPVLQEIQAKILVNDKKEETKMSEFSLKMNLERSQEDKDAKNKNAKDKAKRVKNEKK